MEYRQLGRTDMKVSAISFGAWAIGGTWGPVDDEVSMRALHAAIDAGTNFVDTADVYGDGRSERLVARLRRERKGETIFVATKAGRRLPKQTPEGYSRENLNAWVDRSLKNLEMEPVDLLQLHCPHPDVYDRPEVFGFLDELVKAGKIRHYGISVESTSEALRGIRYPGRSVGADHLQHAAAEAGRGVLRGGAGRRGVGILARVPLASGLLSGKLTKQSSFARDDHRSFNRNGEAFDKGETFSGVPYDVGLERRRAAAAARPGGRDARPARAALHADVRCRHLRDPGSEDARAGPRQRGGGRPRAAAARDDEGGAADLRRHGPAARPRELVGEPGAHVTIGKAGFGDSSPCRSSRELGSECTRSSSPSGPGAWARSTARATRG